MRLPAAPLPDTSAAPCDVCPAGSPPSVHGKKSLVEDDTLVPHVILYEDGFGGWGSDLGSVAGKKTKKIGSVYIGDYLNREGGGVF